jgi:hypothetical protein
MRSLCIATVLAAILASFAFAQSTRNTEGPTQAQLPATSYEVYSGGRRLGTDPDPNIRFEMMRQQNWRGG